MKLMTTWKVKQVSPEAQATIEKWWYKGQHKRHSYQSTVFDNVLGVKGRGTFF